MSKIFDFRKDIWYDIDSDEGKNLLFRYLRYYFKGGSILEKKIDEDTSLSIVGLWRELSRNNSDGHVNSEDFKKAMTYPFVLLATFFLSLIGIFKVVVPKFEFMFSSNKIELPLATKILFITKDIFENYSLYFVVLCTFVLFFIIFI